MSSSSIPRSASALDIFPNEQHAEILAYASQSLDTQFQQLGKVISLLDDERFEHVFELLHDENDKRRQQKKDGFCCAICAPTTMWDKGRPCSQCEKDLESFPKEFPEDSAAAKRYSVYGNGAFHALILRFRAHCSRGSSLDTNNPEQVLRHLTEAQRLDDIATEYLNHKADFRFRPWWYARWEYSLAPWQRKPEPNQCCEICERKLDADYASKDSPDRLCILCDENLKRVPEDYPEDAKNAKWYSVEGDKTFHALVLRIQANDCREAAHDTDDTIEAQNCLKEAERLDAIATKILCQQTPHARGLWWFARWDYYRQPGSTHKVPAWATKESVRPEVAKAITTRQRAQVDETEPETEEETEEQKPPARATVAQKPILDDYKHPFWPSPRPKNFMKAMGYRPRSHADALEFLARRAGLSLEELLRTNPLDYEKKYMNAVAPLHFDDRRSLRLPYYDTPGFLERLDRRNRF